MTDPLIVIDGEWAAVLRDHRGAERAFVAPNLSRLIAKLREAYPAPPRYLRDPLFSLAQRGAVTSPQVARALDISANTAQKRLMRAVVLGWMQRTGRGRYELNL